MPEINYSILFYSILFYSILFYSILFYSILFYSILFYYVGPTCIRKYHSNLHISLAFVCEKHDTVLNLSALYLCFPQFIRAYSLLNLIIQNIWDEKTLDELHQTTSL